MEAQLKKGVLGLIILKIIYEQDTYGYELVEKINNYISVKEGSVYPILKRLTNEKFLDTYLKASDQGPARKYYTITELGKENLEIMLKSWYNFVVNTTEILKGGI